MKIVFIIFLFLFSEIGLFAQNINKIEYFIDADPGYGLGTNVSISANTPVTANFNVSLPNIITDGFHFLSVRARDVNNNWGIVATRPFYKETITAAPSIANITALEYFMDADPGYGLGTPVAVTAGTPITKSFTVALPSPVPDGFHTLSVRTKDANNKWSIVAIRPFYKETVVVNPAIQNITMMEYFIDNDLGYGNGTPISVTAGSSVTQNININLGSLSNGTHKLSIRAKDTNNKWSIVNVKDFTVQDNIVVAGNTPASWCRNTSFSIPFTATGTYTNGNIFTAQLSDVSGSFTSPTTLGTVTGISSGTIYATIPNSVALGTGYKIRIISSTPSITNSLQKTIDVTALCQCLLNLSLTGGTWNTANIWSCGHVPLATEPVQISSGHTVILNVNGVAKSLDLRGVLQHQNFSLRVQGN